jgi:putative addiction module component (TIGR02574 family)
MATELEQCEQYAMKLPLQERALLIKRLIEGLDELDEQNLERLWVQEAARRVKEFEAGSIKARSAEDVFCDARARLQNL